MTNEMKQWMRECPSIHLVDFHNPPYEKLGANFDAKQIVSTLVDSGIKAVVLFSKDNYGYSYYDTEIGTKHPGLDFDYFGELVRESKKNGLKVLVYHALNIEWLSGLKNTDWIIAAKDGRKMVHFPNSQVREWGDESAVSAGENFMFSLAGTANDKDSSNWFKHPTFHFLCVNSPYIQEMLLPQLDEIITKFDVDGFFMDTLTYPIEGCYCDYCRKEMALRGIDIENKKQVDQFRKDTMLRVGKMITEFVHKRNPNIMMGYDNTCYMGCRRDDSWNDYWWWEAGNWQLGFYHAPMFSRYLRNSESPFSMEVGRFHQMWGDFGGYKHINEMKYECATLLANGSIIWLSTQMSHDCKMERDTYDRMKECNRFIDERKEYFLEARAPKDIAVYGDEGFELYSEMKTIIFTDLNKERNFQGATKMLMEMHQQFDLIDETSDLSEYKVLIIPEVQKMSDEFIEKVREFVANGGTLFLSQMSSFSGYDFKLADVLGVNYVCTSPYTRSYARVRNTDLTKELPEDFMIYETVIHVNPQEDTEVLGNIVNPLFERTLDRFHSHAQAPAGWETDYPVATVHNYGKGKAVYIALPIFTLFHSEDYFAYRNFFENVYNYVRKDSFVAGMVGPRSMELNVMEQKDKNRYLVHLVNCQTRRFSSRVPRMEDVIPVYDVEVKLNIPEKVKSVTTPLDGTVEWTQENGILNIKVSKVDIHNIVVVQM